jgi:protein involved in polysaccharide export with SLBB domain
MTEMVPKTYVSINGNVKRPGRFLLQENMTLYDLIFKAGGYVDEEYKKLTYLKRAELVRVSKNSDEKEIIPFNLGLVLDKQGIANTALRTDDAIQIYSVNEIEGDTRYVSISGHVKRPGQYELFAGNMTLYDLIFKAGGYVDEEYKKLTYLKRADLIRFDNNRITQSIIPFNLDSVLSDKSNKQNIILLPGDVVIVYSKDVFNTLETVSINGIVRSPGSYNLKTGMTLKDLILEAGGLNEGVYRYRVEVARIDPLNNSLDEYAEVITFNIDEKFDISVANSYDDSKKGLLDVAGDLFQLNPHDLVSIRPDPYFSKQRKVTISGEVLYPGDYTIINSNEKITDIIKRAGGLLPNAYPDASQYTRQGIKINASLAGILKNPKSKLNFEVQDGDKIIIVPHPNVIMITGEVNTSGIHKYVPGKRLRYYLKLAGGINPDADKNNIWVAYPSGDSKKYKSWSLLSPKVIDGSSIVIGKQKEKEPFDQTEFATELASIMTDFAQLALIIAALNQ